MARWLGAASLACAFSALAGINSWTSNGPDTGWVFAVAMQPTNAQVALASSSVASIAPPMAASIGRWSVSRSTPRATLFSIGHRGPCVRGGWRAALDQQRRGPELLAVAAPEFGVRQVEISSGGVLYVQTYGARMFKSPDHGTTWIPCGRPWGDDAASNSFAVDPNPSSSSSERLYIEILGGNVPNGTWRSTDGCANWLTPGAASPGSGTDGRAYHYSVKTGDSNRVLAATNLGVKLSTDAGASWNAVTVAPAYWVEYDRVSTSKAVAITEITHSMCSTDSGDTGSSAMR
jgi:hypothetical protein